MLRSKQLASCVQRVDNETVDIKNQHGVPFTLFANPQIPIESEAIE